MGRLTRFVAKAAHFVIVSNEVLDDLPSDYAETEIYRKWLGDIHRQLVAKADTAIEMDYGHPDVLEKGGGAVNGLIVLGTASDSGKTMICTALCRLLADEGIRVTPFKSQNMSRFSALTEKGEEMSRAQFIQAAAARTVPTIEMNPILLKPGGGMQSEVFILGESFGPIAGMTYREQFFNRGIEAIQTSLAKLSETYDTVVIEGAGSPAEVNLNDREIVNMRVAEIADVPAIVSGGYRPRGRDCFDCRYLATDGADNTVRVSKR